MKKQTPVRKNGKKTSVAVNKPVAPPFVPSPFPNWIYIVIVAFCFAIYGNTLWNEFALDDTMVLTQNEFVKSGVSGIPKIFKYDTFIGRYGEQIINLPGGRYDPRPPRCLLRRSTTKEPVPVCLKAGARLCNRGYVSDMPP
jgi:hypothetical protein